LVHIGSNTRLLAVSQASKAIERPHMMADLLGFSSNQWNASSLETSHESFDSIALPAKYNIHDMHNEHKVKDASVTNTSTTPSQWSSAAGVRP